MYICHSAHGAKSYFDTSLKYMNLFLSLGGPACDKNTLIKAIDDNE